MEKVSLINDEYRESRGGWSRFLNIYCEKCGDRVLVYQKDGPGELRRLYLDRIFEPPHMRNLHKTALKKIGDLTCTSCGKMFGVPYVYEKENRKAFRLFVGAITKKVTTYRRETG